jgi:hypothetical protein
MADVYILDRYELDEILSALDKAKTIEEVKEAFKLFLDKLTIQPVY